MLDFVSACRKATLPEPGSKFYVNEYEFIPSSRHGRSADRREAGAAGVAAST